MGFLPDRTKVVIRHILERKAAESPTKEYALFEDGETWTYSDALREAYRSANALSQLGIQRGENVLIFLPNSQGWLRTWLGITSLGAVIVPVNTAYKGEILRHVCLDSKAGHIIASPDLAERLAPLGLDLNIVDPASLTEGPADEPKLDEPIEPWDVHAIMYTSGTTGPSKGVITPYLSTYMNGFRYGDRTRPEDTFLVDLPLFHVAGISGAYTLLTVGGRIALRSVFSATHYWDLTRECGATISAMVSTMAEFLVRMPPKPNDADNPVRVVMSSPMVRDPAAFKERFGIEDLYTAYGSTECNTVMMTHGPVNNPKSCGKPRQGIQVRLVDDHEIPVPAGEVGELIVRTDHPWEMNAGYWGRAEESARAWRHGWFHTGDLFQCDRQGNYFFVDRKKDALRRRGENISTFEVEREITAHPDVLDAACVGIQGELADEEVKVFVVPREGCQFDPAELIRFLIPRMPYFMVPRFVEVLPELPKTPTMRVRKFELRERGNSTATWDREAAGIVVTRDSG
jgi:crotonobetaine/carnitine-CoA ligase